MKTEYKILLINWLPLILFAIPMSTMVYIKYGSPSDGFFDVINTIGALVFVSPLLLIIVGLTLSLFDREEDNKKCNCCCCKCHCFKGEK